MYFLVNMGIFQPAMLVYQRVYNILMYLSIVFYCLLFVKLLFHFFLFLGLTRGLGRSSSSRTCCKVRGLTKSSQGMKLFGFPPYLGMDCYRCYWGWTVIDVTFFFGNIQYLCTMYVLSKTYMHVSI